MNRILHNTGGRPAKNEDLTRYIQEFELWEGYVQGVLDSSGALYMIVHGMEISGAGPYDISAGVAYFAGDLCIFDAVIGAASLPYRLKKSVTETDTRTYFDGVAKNTLEVTKLIFDAAGTFELTTTTPRLATIIQAQIDTINTNTGGLKRKVLSIGDWNMNVSAAGTILPVTPILHGITSGLAKIMSVNISILVDDDAVLLATNGAGSSSTGIGIQIGWTDTNISPVTSVGNRFDNASHDKLAFNRGFIVIDYI